MNAKEIEGLAGSVFDAVKQYITGVERNFVQLLKAMNDRIEALPAPQRGEKGDAGADATQEQIDAAAARAVAALDLKNGTDGISPDPAEIQRCIDAAVAAKFEAMPKPQNGKDADAGAILEALSTQLKDLVAAIPMPKDGVDGKNVDPEEIRGMVKAAVGEIPPPPDAAVIIDTLTKTLNELVAALPAPAAGKDADEKAMLEVLKTHIEERIAAIPAPKDGTDGKDADLETVRGVVREVVAEIPVPRDGRDGKDGNPGRDALQIDVIPAIDETRVYPRATYALHKGGIWRSFKTTAGLDGWECVIDGLAAVEVKYDEADPRVVFISITLSSGKQARENLRLPMMIHRGIYSDAKEYEAGDCVTWDGSTWLALVDTKEKPKSGDAWRLIVKGGSRGASAFDTAKRLGYAGNEAEWLLSLKGDKGDKGRDGIDFNRLGPNGGL